MKKISILISLVVIPVFAINIAKTTSPCSFASNASEMNDLVAISGCYNFAKTNKQSAQTSQKMEPKFSLPIISSFRAQQIFI
jgi:hypothetical protein